MSVSIIEGEDYFALYCSTTMFAFGPLFGSEFEVEQIQEFLEWLPQDARRYEDDELVHLQSVWVNLNVCTSCDKRTEDDLKELVIPAHERKWFSTGSTMKFEKREEKCCEECFEELSETFEDEIDGTDEKYDRQRAEEVGRGEP